MIKAKTKRNPPKNQIVIFLINSAVFIHKVYNAYFRRDYSKRSHFEIVLIGWRPSIRLLNHDEYVLEKESELLKMQEELSPDTFILEALRLCKNCLFIIFDCDNGKFVQFWLGDGKIFANWPILKGNKLGKYTYAMLGVLNELGITHDFKQDGKWPNKLHHCYTLVKDKGFDEYAISFGKDIKSATQFTELVITKVFGQNLEDVTFKIG